jgi:hypothetical protein
VTLSPAPRCNRWEAFCAHDPAEGVYLNVFTDSSNVTLSGQYRYTLTFKEGEFPPCDTTKHGFWSHTLYNLTYNLVPGSAITQSTVITRSIKTGMRPAA